MTTNRYHINRLQFYGLLISNVETPKSFVKSELQFADANNIGLRISSFNEADHVLHLQKISKFVTVSITASFWYINSILNFFLIKYSLKNDNFNAVLKVAVLYIFGKIGYSDDSSHIFRLIKKIRAKN